MKINRFHLFESDYGGSNSSSSIAIALQTVSGLEVAFQTRRGLAHLRTIATYMKRFGIRDGWISESIKNMDFFMPFHATYTFADFATDVTNIAIRH